MTPPSPTKRRRRRRDGEEITKQKCKLWPTARVAIGGDNCLVGMETGELIALLACALTRPTINGWRADKKAHLPSSSGSHNDYLDVGLCAASRSRCTTSGGVHLGSCLSARGLRGSCCKMDLECETVN